MYLTKVELKNLRALADVVVVLDDTTALNGENNCDERALCGVYGPGVEPGRGDCGGDDWVNIEERAWVSATPHDPASMCVAAPCLPES
jgi:hypothetical protein